jgi:hypothetical protein
MNIDQLVAALDARRVRDGEYRARCPVHGGRSRTSLSIKDAGDRVLIHCHAGCDFRHILAALGMKTAAELFNSVRLSVPSAAAAQRARALRGLEIWCDRRLVVVSDSLRDVERAISLDVRSLPSFDQMTAHHWECLSRLYHKRSYLEEEFGILNGRSLKAKLELWRRSR